MTSVSTHLVLVLLSLLSVLPVVEAVEAGDALTLLRGAVLSITGICARLGACARERNGQIGLGRAFTLKLHPDKPLCS
ncbi:small integral membrane protein 30-like [Tupaia chinensis]|uniref:small integral membrane protein 30-like n=1 Tax=Tupaia chinensis TaxID=246437 RepID=UPI000FFBC0BE|nr:small integral membrane protein 30-like [Tupaia chinensis]